MLPDNDLKGAMSSLCLRGILALLLLFAAALQADTFTTLDGERYTGATIKHVEPDGLLIAYSDGVVKLKFHNLPPEIGKQFGYNPTLEAQFLAEKHSNEIAAYQASMNASEVPSVDPLLSANHATSSIAASDAVTATKQVIDDSSPKPFFGSLVDRLKESIKSFITRWLHSLFPWAFSADTPGVSPISPCTSPSPTPTPPPTPQQIVEAVLSKKPIPATELGHLYKEYPALTVAALQSRLVSISGTVETFFISGIDQERAEIKLQTNPSDKNVIIFYNLKRDNPNVREEWKINDQRLFLNSTLICIEGGPLERAPGNHDGVDVRLKNGNLTELKFKLQR